MSDVVIELNYRMARVKQDQKCLGCGKDLPDPAWFELDQTEETAEVYCTEDCKDD